jgi:hypothetical protein
MARHAEVVTPTFLRNKNYLPRQTTSSFAATPEPAGGLPIVV